jgi:MraZ protein
MFIGKYYYNLEENGRLSLPTEFRQKNNSWVVTRGLDGGLFLFKQADFQAQLKNLLSRTFTKKINRDFIRLMTNEAKEVTPDNNGRVQLPEYLITFAKLQKAVVIVGSLEKIEIWDRELYHTYIDTIESKAEVIAEQLDTYEQSH